MASAEHLQQLQAAEESSDSGTTRTESEPEELPEELPEEAPKAKPKPPPESSSKQQPVSVSSSLSSKHPKMRIKLSLKKLPTKEEKKTPSPEGPPKKKSIRKFKLPLSRPPKPAEDNVAQVLDSDDENAEDDAVAIMAPVSIHGTTNKASAPKRRTTVANKGIRIPPLSSPGLLLTSSTTTVKLTPDANGLVTPAAVFDASMQQQGYTLQARTQHPHRGSSVQRVVGDMFDTNIPLALNPPSLISKDLLLDSLPDRLVDSLEALQKTKIASHSKKRKRPLQFADMVPVSLTIPYPESYLTKRLEYVGQVQEREKAIIAAQEAELTQEDNDENDSNNKIPKIPPIPQPPSPPTVTELGHEFAEKYYDDRHPIYLPKNKEDFVAHLDKQCFHITKGRYFGLQSNFCADPNFVGPNATGIPGVNATGGAGLATSSTGTSGTTSTSAGSALVLSTAFHGAATNITTPAAPKNTTSSSINSSPPKKTTPTKADEKDDSGSGPKPTATAADLRKVMEEGGSTSESMKNCIIRAAVHASRSGRHGQSFMAEGGEIYPDVSKAFAAHAGIKPCIRCKNNKQGVRVFLYPKRMSTKIVFAHQFCFSGLSLSIA